MTTIATNAKKEKIKRIVHLLGGFIILFHGYERWEHEHSSYLFFFIAGAVFLAIAVLHHRLAARFSTIDTVFFFIEAMLSFIIAWEYFEMGKKALPFVYVFAGILQLSSIFIWRLRHRRKG